MLARNLLYSDPDAFFDLEGNAVMVLTPSAAAEVCRMAASRGIVVGRVEGGIWHNPGFEPRHQCIWLGLWPPLEASLAQVAASNEAGANFIEAESQYSAFIVTATEHKLGEGQAQAADLPPSAAPLPGSRVNHRTKYVSIVAATLIAAMAWWAWRTPGANAKSDMPSAEAASASDGISTPQSSRYVLSTNPVRTDRLGDPNLDLLATLRRAVAERGPDDLIVADMNAVGLSACLMVRDIKSDDFRRKAPRHAWAVQRVEHACKEFAIQGTKPVDIPALRDFRALRSQDPEAATLRALDILRTSDSRLQMRAALTHLEDERKFPLDYDPALDPIELAKATEYAMIPVVCDATNDCGGASLSAAMLCMLDGCSPGTTYDQALRRRLSPREYESAVRMRASLMALRERRR